MIENLLKSTKHKETEHKNKKRDLTAKLRNSLSGTKLLHFD